MPRPAPQHVKRHTTVKLSLDGFAHLERLSHYWASTRSGAIEFLARQEIERLMAIGAIPGGTDGQPSAA